MLQTVLIVDDSPSLHELVKVNLSEEGLLIRSAYDGPSAIALAATLRPDLVLLDVDMPSMSGFDVCRALKADAATAEIPIIFLTASASTEDMRSGFDLRAVDYVTKPFDPAELRACIRSALRIKRLLDMLPKPARAVSGVDAASRARKERRVNARLTLAALTRARSGNPWSRKPPVSSPA